MKEILLVGAGGFLGSIARYGLSLLGARWLPGDFPAGTFTANIMGCLLIGIIMGLGLRWEWMTRDLFLLLATGFCGGFTTFSTFSAENLTFVTTGNYAIAALYLGSSLLLGLAAVFGGLWLVK